MRNMNNEQTFQPHQSPRGLTCQLSTSLSAAEDTHPPANRPDWKAELIPVKIPMAVKEMVTILSVSPATSRTSGGRLTPSPTCLA